jgi:hypothetical protein
MSATINIKLFQDYFNGEAPVVQVPGRLYPINVNVTFFWFFFIPARSRRCVFAKKFMNDFFVTLRKLEFRFSSCPLTDFF